LPTMATRSSSRWPELAPRGPKARQGRRELQGRKGPWGKRGLRETPARRVPRAFREHRELRAPLGPREFRGPRVIPRRTSTRVGLWS
jgi:hypothetical protein